MIEQRLDHGKVATGDAAVAVEITLPGSAEELRDAAEKILATPSISAA